MIIDIKKKIWWVVLYKVIDIVIEVFMKLKVKRDFI